jgi:hypothetical protein
MTVLSSVRATQVDGLGHERLITGPVSPGSETVLQVAPPSVVVSRVADMP